MCGIAGIVQTDGLSLGDVDRRVLAGQLETLAQRGPDASGQFCRGPVAFGHRRLAIRDLDQGQQPWMSPDGSCVLVYNGELYNDDDLRRELSNDYPFETRCDTEVVMAAYTKWGKSCVTRLNGMFAFAVFDFRKSMLWLVRDRFGVKPLYYSRLPGQFVFASHANAILVHPQYSKKPNWSVVSHYLSTTRLTLGENSLYSGIKLLQPAEEMTIIGSSTSTRTYWRYPTSIRSNATFDDAVDLLHGQLSSAVKRRLTSDVPVGLFLSGGVDSCTITSLAHAIESGPRYAACATVESHGVAGHDCNELASAKQCAQQFCAELDPIRVSPSTYLERWIELLREFRLPMSTPSDVMIYELAKAAKSHVGVVLGGEGADELLCGYEVASWSGYDYDATNGRQNLNSQMLQSIARQYGRTEFRNESDHYFALNSLVPTWAKRNMLNPSIFHAIGDDDAMFAHYQSVFDECGDVPTVEKYATVLHRINLEALLSRLDSTTMHASLEARVPFTDHLLVESVLELPFHYRIDAGHAPEARVQASAELSASGHIRSKRMLRGVAKKLLPTQLATRRKESFPTGVTTWIQNEWREFISRYLNASQFARILFKQDFLIELIQAPEKAGMWLWPIVNIVLWGDAEFFDQSNGVSEFQT